MVTSITNSTIATQTAVNSDAQVINKIKTAGNSKEQLKKAASEFEAIFATQMITLMDKTVDSEGGLFGGEDNKYLDNFKSLMFNEMGRQMASNPRTSLGLAKQIYQQMEKLVPDENGIIQGNNIQQTEKNTKLDAKTMKKLSAGEPTIWEAGRVDREI